MVLHASCISDAFIESSLHPLFRWLSHTTLCCCPVTLGVSKAAFPSFDQSSETFWKLSMLHIWISFWIHFPPRPLESFSVLQVTLTFRWRPRKKIGPILAPISWTAAPVIAASWKWCQSCASFGDAAVTHVGRRTWKHLKTLYIGCKVHLSSQISISDLCRMYKQLYMLLLENM